MWRDARAGGGQGPSHRAALAGGAQPGGALRCPRARPLRVRPRSGPRDHGAGPRRAVLGGRAVRRPCSPSSAASPSRPPTARATVCGCRASTRPGCSWARRRRWPPSWSSSRFCSQPGWCCFYGAHVRSYGSLVAACVAGTAGLAAVGHPLRRARCRAAGARDAAAVPGPARGGARAPGRDPGLAGGARDPAPAADAGDPWMRLLLVFAAVYLALGVVLLRTPAGGGGVTDRAPAVAPWSATATRVEQADVGGRASAVGAGSHRVARAVGHASRQGAGTTSSASSTSTRPSPGWRSTWPSARPRSPSLLWLWPRTRSRFWDRLAGAAMEVGIVFTALTLVTGLDLGPADLGGVVGVGRPAHLHGDAARAAARVPGPAPGPR